MQAMLHVPRQGSLYSSDDPFHRSDRRYGSHYEFLHSPTTDCRTSHAENANIQDDDEDAGLACTLSLLRFRDVLDEQMSCLHALSSMRGIRADTRDGQKCGCYRSSLGDSGDGNDANSAHCLMRLRVTQLRLAHAFAAVSSKLLRATLAESDTNHSATSPEWISQDAHVYPSQGMPSAVNSRYLIEQSDKMGLGAATDHHTATTNVGNNLLSSSCSCEEPRDSVLWRNKFVCCFHAHNNALTSFLQQSAFGCSTSLALCASVVSSTEFGKKELPACSNTNRAGHETHTHSNLSSSFAYHSASGSGLCDTRGAPTDCHMHARFDSSSSPLHHAQLRQVVESAHMMRSCVQQSAAAHPVKPPGDGIDVEWGADEECETACVSHNKTDDQADYPVNAASTYCPGCAVSRTNRARSGCARFVRSLCGLNESHTQSSSVPAMPRYHPAEVPEQAKTQETYETRATASNVAAFHAVSMSVLATVATGESLGAKERAVAACGKTNATAHRLQQPRGDVRTLMHGYVLLNRRVEHTLESLSARRATGPTDSALPLQQHAEQHEEKKIYTCYHDNHNLGEDRATHVGEHATSWYVDDPTPRTPEGSGAASLSARQQLLRQQRLVLLTTLRNSTLPRNDAEERTVGRLSHDTRAFTNAMDRKGCMDTKRGVTLYDADEDRRGDATIDRSNTASTTPDTRTRAVCASAEQGEESINVSPLSSGARASPFTLSPPHALQRTHGQTHLHADGVAAYPCAVPGAPDPAMGGGRSTARNASTTQVGQTDRMDYSYTLSSSSSSAFSATRVCQTASRSECLSCTADDDNADKDEVSEISTRGRSSECATTILTYTTSTRYGRYAAGQQDRRPAFRSKSTPPPATSPCADENRSGCEVVSVVELSPEIPRSPPDVLSVPTRFAVLTEKIRNRLVHDAPGTQQDGRGGGRSGQSEPNHMSGGSRSCDKHSNAEYGFHPSCSKYDDACDENKNKHRHRYAHPVNAEHNDMAKVQRERVLCRLHAQCAALAEREKALSGQISLLRRQRRRAMRLLQLSKMCASTHARDRLSDCSNSNSSSSRDEASDKVTSHEGTSGNMSNTSMLLSMDQLEQKDENCAQASDAARLRTVLRKVDEAVQTLHREHREAQQSISGVRRRIEMLEGIAR